jgi:hypothetical protein
MLRIAVILDANVDLETGYPTGIILLSPSRKVSRQHPDLTEFLSLCSSAVLFSSPFFCDIAVCHWVIGVWNFGPVMHMHLQWTLKGWATMLSSHIWHRSASDTAPFHTQMEK